MRPSSITRTRGKVRVSAMSCEMERSVASCQNWRARVEQTCGVARNRGRGMARRESRGARRAEAMRGLAERAGLRRLRPIRRLRRAECRGLREAVRGRGATRRRRCFFDGHSGDWRAGRIARFSISGRFQSCTAGSTQAMCGRRVSRRASSSSSLSTRTRPDGRAMPSEQEFRPGWICLRPMGRRWRCVRPVGWRG